jgi:hypothetical protein
MRGRVHKGSGVRERERPLDIHWEYFEFVVVVELGWKGCGAARCSCTDHSDLRTEV